MGGLSAFPSKSILLMAVLAQSLCIFWLLSSDVQQPLARVLPPANANVNDNAVGVCYRWPSRDLLPTNCPSEDDYVAKWAQRLAEAGKRRKWTILDVGANKGYALAAILEGLGIARNHNLTRQDVRRYRTEEFGKPGKPQRDHIWEGPGACGDGFASVNETGVENRIGSVDGSWQAILVEGQVKLKEGLEWLYQKEPNVAASGGSVTVVHAGCSNQTGTISFDQCGTEACGIAKPGTEGWWPKLEVPLVTIDSVVPKDVDYIDVMMTDTEGHDYFVADGATRFLGMPAPVGSENNLQPETGADAFTAKVGLYIFEIWGEDRPLSRQVQMLHRRGMDCFFAQNFHGPWNAKTDRDTPFGADRMYRVNGRCWNANGNEALFGWGNVVCVNRVREPELLAVLESMAPPGAGV